jgi:hypothetical protein
MNLAATRDRIRLGEVHQEAIVASLRPGSQVLVIGDIAPLERLAAHMPARASLSHVASDERSRLSGGERFDVIILDGQSPDAVMNARHLLREGGRVYLLDAQHACHDETKLEFVEYGTIGPCSDGSPAYLWYGGIAPQPITPSSDSPVVASCASTGTGYEELSVRLQASCEAPGFQHQITPLRPQRPWEADCAAQVCLHAWHALGKSILWVDADTIVRPRPELSSGSLCDFAIRMWQGRRVAGGAVYFAHTLLARMLLERWVSRCRREPRVRDRVHLVRAWEEMMASHPLHTQWLPQDSTLHLP